MKDKSKMKSLKTEKQNIKVDCKTDKYKPLLLEIFLPDR